MSYINKINTIIHRLDNADFDNIVYNQIYVSSAIDVTVNGVSMGVIPILGSPIDIVMRSVTSSDPTAVYLLGTVKDWYRDDGVIISSIITPEIEEFLATETGDDLLTEGGIEIVV